MICPRCRLSLVAGTEHRTAEDCLARMLTSYARLQIRAQEQASFARRQDERIQRLLPRALVAEAGERRARREIEILKRKLDQAARRQRADHDQIRALSAELSAAHRREKRMVCGLRSVSRLAIRVSALQNRPQAADGPRLSAAPQQAQGAPRARESEAA